MPETDNATESNCRDPFAIASLN